MTAGTHACVYAADGAYACVRQSGSDVLEGFETRRERQARELEELQQPGGGGAREARTPYVSPETSQPRIMDAAREARTNGVVRSDAADSARRRADDAAAKATKQIRAQQVAWEDVQILKARAMTSDDVYDANLASAGSAYLRNADSDDSRYLNSVPQVHLVSI